MSVPSLLIEKLHGLPLSEETKKNLTARIIETYPKCMCPKCPSYYMCKATVNTNEPVLYCNPMRGKSITITKELGCLCNACPVYKMNHFTQDGWYCTRGPAKEMVAMMDAFIGEAKPLPRIEPDGTMRIDEKTQTVVVTVDLPGVAQKDINLRIQDSGFRLTARRDDVEFLDSHDFGCLVNPDHAKVKFKDGVLEFHIPVKSKLLNNKKEENLKVGRVRGN